MRINGKGMYLNYVTIFFLLLHFHELLVESDLHAAHWVHCSCALGLDLQHLKGQFGDCSWLDCF